jgi:hypothetical protein
VSTTVSESLIAEFTQNLAAFWTEPFELMGLRCMRSDEVWAGDPQSDSPLLNNAVLLRPHSQRDLQKTLAAVENFYEAASGAGFCVFSRWPAHDLRDRGYSLWGAVPCMVRAPGGQIPNPPADLTVVEATDTKSLRWVEQAFIEGFPAPELQKPRPEPIWNDNVFQAQKLKLWVGICAGQPVSCAMAYLHSAVVGVYLVATVPEMRGRGFGEAVTWHATFADPDQAAALTATSMGRPIYARMGYQGGPDFFVWLRERRTGT